MPKIITLPLAGQSYALPDQPSDAQKSLNLYAERVESGSGKAAYILRPTYGLKALTTLGTGPIRALFETSSGLLLCVSGSSLYKLVGETPSFLTTLATGSGHVSITDNGVTALLVDGTATATTITLATESIDTLSLPCLADQCACCDGCFILKESTGSRFYVSDLLSTTFNVLNFAASEGTPDPLQALYVAGREIWLFGAESTEVWSNAGGSGFPFLRLPGVFIEQGTAAPLSVQGLAGSLYWLGRGRDGEGIVWRSNGYAPERISTHAIERNFTSFARISDAYAVSYMQEGHAFYALTFPAAEKTFVYDAATSQWHERATLDQTASHLGVWKPKVMCASQIGLLAGDATSGTLYKLDTTQTTDDGLPIIRQRIMPYIGAAGRPLTHHSLTLEMQQGVGLQTAPQQSPQIMLRYSDDYGAHYSSERWGSAGGLGEIRPRIRFTRLGQSRNRLYEISYADSSLLSLTQAILEVSDGR